MFVWAALWGEGFSVGGLGEGVRVLVWEDKGGREEGVELVGGMLLVVPLHIMPRCPRGFPCLAPGLDDYRVSLR